MSENIFDKQGSHSYTVDQLNAKAAEDVRERRILATPDGVRPNNLFLATLVPFDAKRGSAAPAEGKAVRLVVAPSLGDVEPALQRGFAGTPHVVESIRRLPDWATIRLSAASTKYLQAGSVLECEVEEG